MIEHDPPVWESVDGQDAAVLALRSAVQREEVAHAWLFVGPPDVGQQAAARALAAALNCPQATAGEGCGDCSTCHRVATGHHPAVSDFHPEGQWHLVSAVRDDWIPAATRSTLEGRVKVLRITAGDRMNEATQNAFLKVLEEPPASVVWVIEVANPGLLLDTVVSRCRRLDFGPLSFGTLAAAAQRYGLSGPRATTLARAAMGSRARLLELTDRDVDAMVEERRAAREALRADLEAKASDGNKTAIKRLEKGLSPSDNELDEQRDQLSAERARADHLDILGRLLRDGPGIVTPLAASVDAWSKARADVQKWRNEREFHELEDYFERPTDWPPGLRKRLEKRHHRLEREERTRALLTFLDELASYLRDLLAVGAGGGEEAVVNLDRLDDLREQARAVPVAAVLDGLAAIGECREALEANGNPVLQLERLLMRIALPLYQPA